MLPNGYRTGLDARYYSSYRKSGSEKQKSIGFLLILVFHAVGFYLTYRYLLKHNHTLSQRQIFHSASQLGPVYSKNYLDSKNETQKLISSNHISQNIISPNHISTNHNEPPDYTLQCRPKKVVFLKVHKAGSTTFQEMFTTYAAKHNFTMSLTRYGFPRWLGGYPGVFNSSFHIIDEPTDLITNHLRWNWEEIMHVLSKPVSHKRIAIVREPFSSFVSAFNYFYKSHVDIEEKLATRHRKWMDPCLGSPYYQILAGKVNASITEFVEKLSQTDFKITDYPWWKRVKNPQSFDFNFQTKNLETDFDLILVLERLPESLVLLKHEICCDWEDIQPYLTFHKNQNKIRKSKNLDVDKLDFVREEYLSEDTFLYKEANRILDAKIEKFGAMKLAAEVQVFLNGNGHFEKPVVPEYFKKKQTSLESGAGLLEYMKYSGGYCE